MRFLTADGVSVVIGLLIQAVLVWVLFRRKLARQYPILVIYLVLNLLEDPLGLLLSARASQSAYMRFYFAVTVLDYLLQLLIIFEVGWNVVRPVKRSIPFPIMPVALVAFLLCAIVAASFSPQVQSIDMGHLSQILVRLTLGLAVLKLLLFAALTAFAQVLGIGWKNHVLQLATGLAFYAAVSLFVQISLSHLPTADHASYVAHFVRLTWFQSVAYAFTLGYWIWAFSRNEAPRKEFTPQMQQVLVTIAQSAKRTRLSVTRSADRR